MSFQIYRNTSVGESLMETIEQLAEDGKLPEEVAMAVLKQFDTVSTLSLAEAPMALPGNSGHTEALLAPSRSLR